MFYNFTMRSSHFIHLLLLAFVLGTSAACRQKSPSSDENAIQIPNETFVECMKPYLNDGYAVRMVPKGNSMLPTLSNGGDVVTLMQVKDLKKGDIVLALTTHGHYVIHRVVGISGQKVILKGDHNKTTETALRSDVIAQLVDKQPIDEKQAAATPVHTNVKAYFKVNPLFRIDTVDSLAWMVDTVARKIDMHKAVIFNEAALCVWNGVKKEGFRLDDMTKALTDVYEVDSIRAANDCGRLLEEWMLCGLVVSDGR